MRPSCRLTAFLFLFPHGAEALGNADLIKEANAGQGMGFPELLKGYMTYILPLIVVVIYLKGYYDMFAPKGMKYLIPWMIVAFAFLGLIAWFAFGGKRNEAKEN